MLLVGLAETGTDERPLLAAPVFLLGLVAGLAPLRAGVPTAIVLACLEGTIEDLLGSPARYWKEAFVAALVVQALLARRPRRVELVATVAIALTYLIYCLTGTSALAAAWAAKILLLSAVAGFAVYRLRPDSRVWRASFSALAVATGANVVVAVWQRIAGFERLVELGFAYADRVRQTPGGDLRAFAALTSSAPFAFVSALALLAWVGMVLGSRDERSRALETAWLPIAAVAGIALAADRIAFAAAAASLVLVALRIVRRRAALALVGTAVLAVGLVFAIGYSSRSFLAEGFIVRSDSAKLRRVVWTEYAKELSPFGAGPGTSGAAYERSAKPNELPLAFVGWFPSEYGLPPFRWMGTTASLIVGAPGEVRPRSRLILAAASRVRPRAVSFALGQTVLATKTVRPRELLSLTLGLPPGRGQASVALRANPGAERISDQDSRGVAIRVAEVRARSIANQTERIYERVVVGNSLSVSALAGTEPGGVDNLYLSWLFQYGIVLGGLVCALFVVILLWPVVRGFDGSLLMTARLWGVFVVIAAAGWNIWEEFPTDLLVALVFGQAFVLLRGRSQEE